MYNFHLNHALHILKNRPLQRFSPETYVPSLNDSKSYSRFVSVTCALAPSNLNLLISYPDIAGTIGNAVDILPCMLYSASLLGIDFHDMYMGMSFEIGLAVLTFVHFNVPCTDGRFSDKDIQWPPNVLDLK